MIWAIIHTHYCKSVPLTWEVSAVREDTLTAAVLGAFQSLMSGFNHAICRR